MIGTTEIWTIVIVALLMLVFGPKGMTNAYRNWKKTRKEMKEIDNEFKENISKIGKDADNLKESFSDNN